MTPPVSTEPKILVVDDEPTLRMGFTFALESEGYAVTTAVDGVDALAKIRENDATFDGMVLDLRMPGKDGITVVRELAESNINIPTVIASAWIDSPTAVEAIEAGTVDFLRKPVTPDDLRGVIQRMLDEDASLDEKAEETANVVSRARALVRRRELKEAQAILLKAKEQADATGEGLESEAKLWLLITSHFLHLAENGTSASELQNSNFYKAADLLEFLAFNH